MPPTTMAAVDHNPPRRTRMAAAQRREVILQAAIEVFTEAGYRAAKMSDIAARVGVTEPVVFQNFGSKPALFAAVLDHAVKQARESIEVASRRFGSAAGLLAHILSQPVHDHGNPVAFGALFADAASLTGDPALSEVSAQSLRELSVAADVGAVRPPAAHLGDASHPGPIHHRPHHPHPHPARACGSPRRGASMTHRGPSRGSDDSSLPLEGDRR
jgi:AcrR family transcriptional regulator